MLYSFNQYNNFINNFVIAFSYVNCLLTERWPDKSSSLFPDIADVVNTIESNSIQLLNSMKKVNSTDK